MRVRGALALCALAACSHSDAFTPLDTATTLPLAAGDPARLTYNPGGNADPSWTPDGRLLYSFGDLERGHDVCLGLLPGSGGRRLGELCSRSPAEADSTDFFEAPAQGSDGRLAYVRAGSDSNSHSPKSYEQLQLGHLDNPAATVLRTLPYVAPNGRLHTWITQIRWLDAQHLVYLGGNQGTVDIGGGATMPFTSGLDIVAMDLSSGAPALSVVPAAGDVSSIWLAEHSDVLYYTLNGDSRVFRRAVAGGPADVLFDFGAGVIARDASVAGRQLTAVLGGKVRLISDPAQGAVQLDEGGVLTTVDLTTGARQTAPSDARFYRRAALSPSGTALAAEGYPVTYAAIRDPVTNVVIGIDTVVTKGADLWLFAR